MYGGTSAVKDGSSPAPNHANEMEREETASIESLFRVLRFLNVTEEQTALRDLLEGSHCGECIFYQPIYLTVEKESFSGECHANPPVVTERFSGRPETSFNHQACRLFLPRGDQE